MDLFHRRAALLRSTSAPYGGASPRYNGSPHSAAAGRWRPEPRASAGRESPARSQPGSSDAAEPHSNGAGGGGGSLPSSPRRMMASRPAPLERGELPAAAGRPYERLPAPPPLLEEPASRGGSPTRTHEGLTPKESGTTPNSSGLGPTSFRGIRQLAGAAPRASAEPAVGGTAALPPPPAIPQPPLVPSAAGYSAATSAAQPKGLLSSVLDMDSCHSADLSVLSQVCSLETIFAPDSPSRPKSDCRAYFDQHLQHPRFEKRRDHLAAHAQ